MIGHHNPPVFPGIRRTWSRSGYVVRMVDTRNENLMPGRSGCDGPSWLPPGRRDRANASHASVPRTARGKIQRSRRRAPRLRPPGRVSESRRGYVIDHIVPLACGGTDAPGNLQWQTVAEGKAKDRTERVGCQ